jgi:S1-C subfamily serine protease
MLVIAALVDAIAAFDQDAGVRLATKSRGLLNDKAEFAEASISAGFQEVSAARIKVVRQFRDFDDLLPSLLGSTPSTPMLAALPAHERETVRRRMQSRFAIASSTAQLLVVTEAHVVRSRV